MKFIVTVVDANSSKYVVDIKEGNVGLKEIDQVRRDLSMWIDIDKFRLAISSFYSKTVSFELSEKNARATGLFLDTSTIQVHCDEYLTRFVEIKSKLTFGDDNKIMKVTFYYEVNSDLLRANWFDAGFPLIWKNVNNKIDDKE